MPPVSARFLGYGVKWQGQLEMSSWPELSTDFLPGFVCRLWAVVISPAKRGDTTHHLRSSPLCTLVQAMITRHLPAHCSSILTSLPVLILTSLKSSLHAPARAAMMLTVSIWTHLVCLLSCYLLSDPCPGMQASRSPLHPEEPIHWLQRGGSPSLLPAAFALVFSCSHFFQAVLFTSWASLKWESGNGGLSFSSATSWLGALKTVTYLLWACFLTCKERVYLFARAAIINYYRLGSLNIRSVFSHNSGD